MFRTGYGRGFGTGEGGVMESVSSTPTSRVCLVFFYRRYLIPGTVEHYQETLTAFLCSIFFPPYILDSHFHDLQPILPPPPPPPVTPVIAFGILSRTRLGTFTARRDYRDIYIFGHGVHDLLHNHLHTIVPGCEAARATRHRQHKNTQKKTQKTTTTTTYVAP